MLRRALAVVGVFLLVAGASSGLAQETETTEAAPYPAASRSEMDCSGFIAGTPVSKDLYVFDGADNDNREPLHQFALVGSYVYLRSRTGQGFAVGSEYSVVRSAKELMRIKWYPGQGGSVRSLGHAYEDAGRVKVQRMTPFGAVAEVTSACGPMRAGDIVMPYQTRNIPEYTPAEFDRFSLPNGRQVGAITAVANNGAFAAQGRVAYINLGQEDGVRVGQRFRIFRIFRENLDRGFFALPETPRETIGELVILSVQDRSSVCMVTKSIREISLGDGIELLD